MSVSEAMRIAKYRPSYAKNPQAMTRSKGMSDLMEMVFPKDFVATKHRQLLNASKVEHLVFPLAMTDKKITEILARNNCTVTEFMHSETQTHVWFFTADNMAQDKALDKIYKLRGEYAPEELDVTSKGLSLADLFERAEERKKAEARQLAIINKPKAKKPHGKRSKPKAKKA